MIIEPSISRLRLPIHRPSHITKKRWTFPADTITSPYMLPVHVDLIIEIVKDCNIESSNRVDIIHNLFKLLAMSSFCLACSWVSNEKIGMDHFMQ